MADQDNLKPEKLKETSQEKEIPKERLPAGEAGLEEKKEAYLRYLTEKLKEKPAKAEKELKAPLPPSPKKEEKVEKKEKIGEEISPRAREFKTLTGRTLEEIAHQRKLEEMSKKEKEEIILELFGYPPYPEQIGKEEIQAPLIEKIKEKEEKT